MITEEQQVVSYLFKKSLGKADTSISKEFYEESLPSVAIVTPENLWFDASYIPTTAPSQLEDNQDYIAVLTNGSQLPILRRHIDLPLIGFGDSSRSFYHPELQYAIPHDYKDGSFHYTLKDNNGQELAYGLNNWVVDSGSGVLTFFGGTPAGVALPLKLSFYKYIGRFGLAGVVRTDGTTPMEEGYVPQNPQDVMTKGYTDEGLSTLDAFLEKLKPKAPGNIDVATLTMAHNYTAFESGTGTSHVCCDMPKPTLTFDKPFMNGDAGVLKAFQDGFAIGTITLTPGNDAGTNEGLTIIADEDPYAGVEGKAGFYHQLRASVTPVFPLTTGLHEFWASFDYPATNTKAYIPGDPANTKFSNHMTFYKDDPETTTVIGVALTLPPTLTRFVSGVPSLDPDSYLNVDFTVHKAVKTHYGALGARITSSQFQNVDGPISFIPSSGADLPYSKNLTVRPNVYTETPQFQLVGLNSKQDFGTPILMNPQSRIDTISDESIRVASGLGDYPSDYGTTFDSRTSLATNEELQLLGGLFQWPTGDYSANQPVAGPNYTALPKTGTRWATFQPLTLVNNNGFILSVNNAQSWTADSETNITSNVRIYARIVGAGSDTGWINCNSPYPGVGIPVNDGDTAMLVGGSSATTKKITFGPTVRSGKLYIRIGFQYGNLKFGTISALGN